MPEGAPPPNDSGAGNEDPQLYSVIDASAGTPVPERRDDKAWLAAHGGKINAPLPAPGSKEAESKEALYAPADLSEGNLEAKEVSDKRRDAIRALFKDPLARGDKILLTGIKQVLDKPNRRFDLPTELNNPRTNDRVRKLLERLDQGQSLGSIFGEARDARDQPTIDALRALARHGLEQFAPKAGEDWGDFARKNPVQAKWVRSLEQLMLMGGVIKGVHEVNTNSLAKEKREGLVNNLQRYAAQPDVPELHRRFFEGAASWFAEASPQTSESTSQPEPAAASPKDSGTSEAASLREAAAAQETSPAEEAIVLPTAMNTYEQLRHSPDAYLLQLTTEEQASPSDFDRAMLDYHAQRELEGSEDRFNTWLARAIPPDTYRSLAVGNEKEQLRAQRYLANFAHELSRQEAIREGLGGLSNRFGSGFASRRELLGTFKALLAPLRPRWQQEFFAKRQKIANELYRLGQARYNPNMEAMARYITKTNLEDMIGYRSYEQLGQEVNRASRYVGSKTVEGTGQAVASYRSWQATRHLHRAQQQEASRMSQQGQAEMRIQMSRRQNQLLEEARRAKLPAAERLKLEKEEEELRKMQLENIKRRREELEAASEPTEDEEERQQRAEREAEALREQRLRNEALRIKNARERERLRKEREERRRQQQTPPTATTTP